MMTIRLPADKILAACKDGPKGRALCIPVHLGLPELRLTEEQIIANAIAHAAGQLAPYPNRNIMMVEIPWEVLNGPRTGHD